MMPSARENVPDALFGNGPPHPGERRDSGPAHLTITPDRAGIANPMARIDPKTVVWSPSLRQTFRRVKAWMAGAGPAECERIEARLHGVLRKQPTALSTINLCLFILGHDHGMQACRFSAQGNRNALARALRWSVDFAALEFRARAGIDLQPAHALLVLPFQNSMRVAGKVMLAQWRDAEIAARLLIEVAHKALTVTPPALLKDGWGKGTNDAFLIALLSEAFAIPTHYEPLNPLIPEYRVLLDEWRTIDAARYRRAMQAAITFHITRSKASTDRQSYEFDHDMHRVYPAELLAVQALRRRDGLPEFSTGDLLVDTPWSIVRDLPEVAPSPLAVQAEALMKRAFPNFR